MASSNLGGRKTPSIAGSRASVYSHGSTVRTVRTGVGVGKGSSRHSSKPAWYRRPILRHVFYTDLQRGAWHIGFYSLFLSLWTLSTCGFDLYCLHEASPGSKHTGYYIISFDFVYVGNPHVRNLLVMSAVFSMFLGLAVLVTSVMLLDALRKEQEHAFIGWLWSFGLFTIWRWVAWVYGSIVNDIIFAYNIVTFIAWLVFNLINPLAFLAIYSLYLELTEVTKIQDLARLKMDTMSSLPASRAASTYGSRPTSPFVNRDTWRRDKEPLYSHASQPYGHHQPQQHYYGHQQQYPPQEPPYGYSTGGDSVV